MVAEDYDIEIKPPRLSGEKAVLLLDRLGEKYSLAFEVEGEDTAKYVEAQFEDGEARQDNNYLTEKAVEFLITNSQVRKVEDLDGNVNGQLILGEESGKDGA